MGDTKMAVLVTGGCGFIGRFLVRELVEREVGEIRVVDIKIDSEFKAEMPTVKF